MAAKKCYLENDYYIKPSFYDLDPMGVVWHGNYIKFMEQAREAMLEIIDYNYDIMTAKGVMWPIVKLEIKYINSYSFKYSPRPHTAAALMEDQIPEAMKKQRLAKLDSYLNELQRQFNESCIGKTLECLCEGLDKTGKHLIYRTPYMQQCVVNKPAEITWPILARIDITEANKASLRGTFSK